MAGEVKKIWDLMDASYDNFVRTTDADHEKQVTEDFKNCTNREIFTRDTTRVVLYALRVLLH